MASVHELIQFLDEWYGHAAEQLENCRKCMGLSEHPERLRRLLAASTEFENLRAKLQQQLREEKRAGNHPDLAHAHMDKIHEQCRKLRPSTRKLLVAISQTVEQWPKVTAAQRTNTQLKGQREDMVMGVDVVEDGMEELLDSVEELSRLLNENGGHGAIGHRVEVPSDVERSQEEEPA